MGSGSVQDRPSVLSMTGSTPTGHVHPYFGCKLQYLCTFGTSIRVLLIPVLELLQWTHVELECKARIVLLVKKLGEASSSNAPLLLKHNKVLSHFPASTSSFPLWLLGINHSTQYRSHRSRASDHLSVRTLFPLSGNEKNDCRTQCSTDPQANKQYDLMFSWLVLCTMAIGGRNCHEYPAQFCKVQFSKMFRFSKSYCFVLCPAPYISSGWVAMSVAPLVCHALLAPYMEGPQQTLYSTTPVTTITVIGHLGFKQHFCGFLSKIVFWVFDPDCRLRVS